MRHSAAAPSPSDQLDVGHVWIKLLDPVEGDCGLGDMTAGRRFND
jgi:hypothetical protein